ncbi:MAG: hypothetical protein A3G30_04090 [Chlamydiae bacterium RIFCSPLOWO2_12_FULL_49_12]|nr:MAG: hypothetical protein A3E26_00020 [Chlamydiae bacterium RIFCSPHIGHO2_12_FULL_49_32]OGN69516.1 MAG: hypothetical protein A3I15_02215 [Chlamydiae bacterium RIFCSPLOWO2_02_FULL_49_12]OGN71737.1 MAG: hypothetical protein A3G30_04090 [Chlamydiae bacterium RIFCSPLOWO2_12_FULL_49_12]HCJ83803.1 hypothetical protein [Parachlamydiales bacterium]
MQSSGGDPSSFPVKPFDYPEHPLVAASPYGFELTNPSYPRRIFLARIDLAAQRILPACLR